MDSVVLQLFTVEEILERLSRKRLTGCFHTYTPQESANIYFKDGMVVSAIKGQVEGEEVLKQILEWKNTQNIWQPESTISSPSAKPLQIHVADFLAKNKPRSAAGGKSLADTSLHPVYSIPNRGATTAPLPPAAGIKQVESPQVDLTATKNFNPTSEAMKAHEDALLAKYKLVLVSTEIRDQRYKITRVSNLIGRSPACAIAISHPSISRQHCLLQLTDRGIHVKDLDTTNGTKVNGIVLKEGYINVGDKLILGHLGFVLEKE